MLLSGLCSLAFFKSCYNISVPLFLLGGAFFSAIFSRYNDNSVRPFLQPCSGHQLAALCLRTVCPCKFIVQCSIAAAADRWELCCTGFFLPSLESIFNSLSYDLSLNSGRARAHACFHPCTAVANTSQVPTLIKRALGSSASPSGSAFLQLPWVQCLIMVILPVWAGFLNLLFI